MLLLAIDLYESFFPIMEFTQNLRSFHKKICFMKVKNVQWYFDLVLL